MPSKLSRCSICGEPLAPSTPASTSSNFGLAVLGALCLLAIGLAIFIIFARKNSVHENKVTKYTEDDIVQIDTTVSDYPVGATTDIEEERESSKVEEKSETKSSYAQYSDVVGRWRVDITTLGTSYELVIYKENGVYYANGIAGRQTLKKERNKYYDVDGSFGEYYQVVGSQLKVCDQDGWLDYFVTTYLGSK